jgi:hypothetical protein
MATTKTAGPKPRTIPKTAVKVCEAGHRVAARWKPGDFCGPCFRAKREADEIEALRNDPIPIPDDMVMRCGDGSVITYRIPRGLRRAGRRGRR